MALHDVKVTYNPGGIGRLQRALRDFSKEPEIQEAVKQWTNYYRAFLRKRFALFSRGGGNWAPLAFSTLNRRRKGKTRSKPAKKNPAKSSKPKKPAKPKKPTKPRKKPPTAAQIAKQLERERAAFWKRA